MDQAQTEQENMRVVFLREISNLLQADIVVSSLTSYIATSHASYTNSSRQLTEYYTSNTGTLRL